MPVFGQYGPDKSELYRLAQQQVAKKFPRLTKNTPGWHRAVENRFKRLYK